MDGEFPFKWISWIAATGITVASSITFFYSTFSTKADAQTISDRLNNSEAALAKRLDRIEDKIDQLMRKH